MCTYCCDIQEKNKRKRTNRRKQEEKREKSQKKKSEKKKKKSAFTERHAFCTWIEAKLKVCYVLPLLVGH